MIKNLLGLAALGALMLAPASAATRAVEPAPAGALPASAPEAASSDGDMLPAPMALLLALAAAGLFWGRRLNAAAAQRQDDAKAE